MKQKKSVYDSLVGEKFGRLTVLERAEDKITSSGYVRPQMLCLCDCGNTVVVMGKYLKNGDTKSCGCLHKEGLVERNKNGSKQNIYDFSNEYGIVWNSEHTEYFIFDKEDYDLIKDIYWNDHKGYAYGGIHDTKENVQMSRLIMGVTDSNLDVDHINHNTHDNRKSNLRVVTHQQNMCNTKLKITNKSGYAGIYEYVPGKFKSIITYYGKGINLGTYDNIEDALIARKNAEEKYYGEYSYDNSMKISNEIK